MNHPYYRKAVNIIGLGFSIISTAIVLFFLFWILSVLFYKGLQEFSFTIFTQNTPPPGESGGLINALWGSFLMTGFAILIAAPIGILAGTFLSEFANKTKFAQITRFVNDILLSAPSIVIGLFVYEIYVRNIGHFSGWAGVFALVLIAIPLIVRTTDDILRLVPTQLREASAALGAPVWMTTTYIIFRVAKPGIITGTLLAIARISGETAPLLFTALNNDFFSSDLNKPTANLPNTIFKFAMSPYENWQHLAWQAVFILIVWVLFCNLLVRVLFKPKLKIR